MMTSHLAVCGPRSLALCTLWVSVFVVIYCRRKHLWWWLSKVMTHNHNRMPLTVIVLSYSCSIKIVLAFTLGPWPIQSKVVGCPSNVNHGFHPMEWVLNPIKWWLRMPKCEHHYCTIISRSQVTLTEARVYSWVGGYISPLLVWRRSSVIMNASHGIKL